MPFEITCVLSEDARELLLTLALRVRVLSLVQIARTWPKAVGRLGRLEKEGLIVSFTAIVHPELPLKNPFVYWRRGEASPDFGKVSQGLRSRWNQPALPMKCFIASRLTGGMFGGHGGRYPRESEETHDIHLSAVYLRLRKTDLALAETWIHEEEIRRARRHSKGKLPDAVVANRKVIEFGGAYKKQKLVAFHKFCETKYVEYEVW